MLKMLIILLSVTVLLIVISYLWGSRWVAKFRRIGIYPQKGQTTEADIKRLALSGHRILAINAYREIYGASLKKARKEVDKILAETIVK